MKSTSGSAGPKRSHRQVKFIPSIRNWFSLLPEPNAETVVTAPAERRGRDTPGASLTKSNMLARRVGIELRSSAPNRVPNEVRGVALEVTERTDLVGEITHAEPSSNLLRI